LTALKSPLLGFATTPRFLLYWGGRDGENVGLTVGLLGCTVGFSVGLEGLEVGTDDEGIVVGRNDGCNDGDDVGRTEGDRVVGVLEGRDVG
jgi:hypothetical protein